MHCVVEAANCEQIWIAEVEWFSENLMLLSVLYGLVLGHLQCVYGLENGREVGLHCMLVPDHLLECAGVSCPQEWALGRLEYVGRSSSIGFFACWAVAIVLEFVLILTRVFDVPASDWSRLLFILEDVEFLVRRRLSKPWLHPIRSTCSKCSHGHKVFAGEKRGYFVFAGCTRNADRYKKVSIAFSG